MRKTFVLAFLIIGCGNDAQTGPQLLPGFNPPAPPANGFQVILPIVKDLQPGHDYEMCTWTDKMLDHDTDVKAVQGLQSKGGHHVIMFSTLVTQPPGTTRVCTDADMATFRFGAASGGEGTADLNMAPGNLVYRLPKGAQIVVNHHYINATTDVLSAQSALNVTLADPNAQNIPSGTLTFLDTTMKVPVGGGGLDISCTMNQDFSAWVVFPHMHEHGTHMTVDLVPMATPMQAQRLFDVQWDPSYVFHPPSIKRDPTDPFQFRTGDQVKIHCDWENTSAGPYAFGVEMCVAFAATINTDNRPDTMCDKGQWGTF
jgi:hypothetical protein